VRAVLVCLVIALGTAPTSAEETTTEAQQLFDEGTRLFTEDASYDAARDAFQRSHALAPSWRALNGVALTYQEQGRFLDAIVTYEKLQREFDTTLTTEQRATVQKRIVTLEAKIGVLELSAEQAGSAIALDGVPVDVAPLRTSVRVMPGRQVVVATFAGHMTLTRTLDVAAGARTPVSLGLEPERVIVRTAPVRLERRVARWVPYATLAGSGGVIVAGALLHLAARSNFDAFDASVASASRPTSVPGDRDLYDRGVLESRLATGSFIVGGLGAIAGAVLLALNQPRPVELVAARRGVGVLVRF